MAKNNIKGFIFMNVIAGLVTGLVISSVTRANPLVHQTTTFINVGEGDSALLQDGNGFSVLIDGGVAAEGPTVDQFLHTQGIAELNVLMASHADADHIGGLITVLQDASIQIDQVLYNGYPGSTTTWTVFSSVVTARGLTLTAADFPQVLAWGGMTAHILNPPVGLSNPDTNDASIVARVDYGTTDTLFTGDISSTIEATVVAQGTSVAAGVLKVAHHGSAYSSGNPFLAAVHPNYGIISVGPNSYGHPSAQTIARLINAGAQVWRTDLAGNIQVIEDGASYSINPQFPFLVVYLPFIGLPMSPTLTPMPTMPPGANVSCNTNLAPQLCAWVIDPNPAKNSTVTVYGQFIMNGITQPGQVMSATWHFKSTTSTCSGTTDTTGIASCSRAIGSATTGYQVNVDVSIGGYTATTWFTPK